MAHHQRWVTATKLGPKDTNVIEHHHLCSVLATAASYDGLNAVNCACIELVCCKMQKLEQRCLDKIDGEDAESHLWAGTTGAKGILCLAPDLATLCIVI